jgi:hypothetical protein
LSILQSKLLGTIQGKILPLLKVPSAKAYSPTIYLHKPKQNKKQEKFHPN